MAPGATRGDLRAYFYQNSIQWPSPHPSELTLRRRPISPGRSVELARLSLSSTVSLHRANHSFDRPELFVHRFRICFETPFSAIGAWRGWWDDARR